MNLPALIGSAACAISLFVGFWHLLVYYRGAGEKVQLVFALTCFSIGLHDVLRIGIAVFLLGALNDIAVSSQVYPSLYLMEVAYLGLILAVTWGMSHSVLELAVARAELRREHVRIQRIFDFALVVLDRTMPVLSGDELLQRMREVRPELPAVLISGYSDDGEGEQNTPGHRTVFVQKPFSLEVLRDQVRALDEQ